MIEIYTDGGYSSSRDNGGWAFVVIQDGIKIHSSFFPEAHTTNNRMEIQAAMEACKWAISKGHKQIIIYTDSMYLIGTMSKGWKRNKNNDLWDEFDLIVKKVVVTWTHIKGHSGNIYNELCDALAVQATFIT
ncbi:MAG: ribonuclease HI [Candidatus Saccharimonadaceae bacterium]